MPAPILQFKRGNAGVAGTVPALRPGEPAISLNNFDFFIGIDTSVANNKFFGSHRYWGREDGTNSLRLKLVDKNGSNYVAIAASDTLSGIATYRLPNTTNGTSGDYLKLKSVSGGYYDLEWSTIPSGSFNISGDTGTDVFTTGGTLTFSGTSSEIETTVTDNQVQIGLPNNVVVGGALTVTTGAVIDGVQIGINGSNIIDTVSGNLTLNSASGQTIIDDAVTIQNNLTVNGNVTVGGTAVTLRGQDVFIENKDIILGYTTSITPNDNTANHAGVAIASTEGSPLVSFEATGINTLPNTYKQMMWFKSGTLGFSTDIFAFNYGVAIGTTTVANGVRLAVGSNVTITDTTVTATTGNFTNLSGTISGTISTATRATTVDTVTASDASGNYYLTFVNSHNGSASAETLYTDDGVYYDPSANKFTTQHALFTGNVEVQGTLTGTATTATRATLIDSTNTTNNSDYFVTFVDTLAGQNSETLRVGLGLSVNPSNGDVKTAGTLSVGNNSTLTSYIKSGGGSNAMYIFDNGDVSFQSKLITNQIRSSGNASTLITLSDLDATFARNVSITGIATVSQLKVGTGVAVTQFSSSVSTGTSTSSVPTSSAVIDYVYSQVGNVDLTLGITADTGGPSTVNTSQTLTVSGTANEIETSVSGQTITVGLPDTVVVGTSLSAPTVKTATIQHRNGTQAITIDTSGNVTASQNLTVSGNLYVNGSTTQVDTTSLSVEDRTVELGRVVSGQPTSTSWDLAVLFNYGDGAAKKAGLVWEASGATKRFQFTTDVDPGSDGDQSQTNLPQFTVSNFAPIEVSELWVNNTCTGGSQQVIGCSAGELKLQNITVDAGTF